MGYEAIADIAKGIWERWFSKPAKQESRANEIDRLEREQKDLATNNPGGRNDKRLAVISARLLKLNTEAKNTRPT